MNLLILISLLAFASLFGIIAGMSKDRVYLLPMAGILVLASSMMFLSGSVQYQDGFNATETQIDSNTTEITRTPTYSSVDENYSALDFSTTFGIVLLIISLYSFFLGADLTGTIRRS